VLLGAGSLVFPENIETKLKGKGFRPELVLETLNTRSISSDFRGANTLVVVPAMLHSIYEQIGRRKSNSILHTFARVRLILVGGQSLGNGYLYSQTRRYFPNARIVQTYACTEAGSSITFEDLGFNNHKGSRTNSNAAIHGATCVGLPPAHIQIGIFGDKKELLSHGYEVGIIGTRGTHVMSGYWKRGDARTQSTETIRSGWMFTSDMGYIDVNSGRLYFCGRANDVIRTGGESVLATEVENVVGLHPDILEVAVFALPHEKFGEVVCAAVVTRKRFGSDKLQTLLRHHCRKHNLAGFKHPRRVFCMQSLPRNSSGKVLKQFISKSCSQMLTTTKSRL
jgi:fatty-acyl-CoA synthase